MNCFPLHSLTRTKAPPRHILQESTSDGTLRRAAFHQHSSLRQLHSSTEQSFSLLFLMSPQAVTFYVALLQTAHSFINVFLHSKKCDQVRFSHSWILLVKRFRFPCWSGRACPRAEAGPLSPPGILWSINPTLPAILLYFLLLLIKSVSGGGSLGRPQSSHLPTTLQMHSALSTSVLFQRVAGSTA